MGLSSPSSVLIVVTSFKVASLPATKRAGSPGIKWVKKKIKIETINKIGIISRILLIMYWSIVDYPFLEKQHAKPIKDSQAVKEREKLKEMIPPPLPSFFTYLRFASETSIPPVGEIITPSTLVLFAARISSTPRKIHGASLYTVD